MRLLYAASCWFGKTSIIFIKCMSIVTAHDTTVPQPDGGTPHTTVGLSVTAGVLFVVAVIACILYAAKGR